MLGLIIAFTLITRLWNLHLPTEYYFDEVYNAFTTQEIVKNNIKAYEWFHTSPVAGTAYGWTHPPLAKLISALGILTFGDNSFGWRVSGAIAGTAVVYLTYLIAKEIIDKKYALVAALLVSLDGLVLVQSRINMNDIYALFFILLVFYFFVKKRFLLLALSLGLLLATKWTGLYAIAIFGWRKNLIGVLIVVLGIYLLSYSHYFLLGGTWQNFIELQKQIQFLENTIRQYLSKEALTRYFTIKSTNPQFAIQVLAFIHQAVTQKHIKNRISDDEFKDLLKRLQEPKKEFRIRK